MSDLEEEMSEHSLLAERLFTGDRASIVAAGMALAHGLKEMGCCSFSVDALGRVVLLPKDKVKILSRVLVPFEDLDSLTEDEAVSVMVKEGRSDEDIISYLSRRPTGEKNVL